MAQNYGPRIVTENLLLSLDPSQNKSYPATDLPLKDGLIMWMDAADDTTFSYSSGTTVSQWRDKSGFNYHMTPLAGSPTRNAFLNSRKVLAFTTSQDIQNLSIDLRTSPYTVFIISRYTSPSSGTGRILTSNGGYNNWLLGHWASETNKYFANGWVYSTYVALDTNWKMYLGDWGGPSNDLANFYGAGTAIATNSADASAGPWTLGINANSGERSNCEAAEIIVYNRLLTPKERNLVHTYLGEKWGISNSDRQIFDLSGNNFNFSFNGTNPRYNAKTIVSNFNTTTPYAVGSFGGQNLTSTILNLLYVDHTIEVAVNLKGFKAVKSFDNARDYEGAAGIILWQGYHGGLYVDAATQKLTYLIWNSDPTNVYTEYVLPNDLKDKILYITAKRQANVLSIFINGVLVAGPTSITTTVRSYSQINIGAAYQGDPSSGGSLGAFVWAGQHEYHLLRMYNKALSSSEIVSNYQAFKARFDLNVARYGLVLELNAGNPTSYAGSGSTWYDTSGTGNNGTLTYGPTYNSTNGGVVVLDGVDDYVTCANSTSLQITNALTLEIWFYNTASVDGLGMIVKGPLSSDYDYMLYLTGNSTLAYFYKKDSGGGIHYGGTTLSLLNRWLHIVVTHTSGGVYTMYANGVAIDSAGFSNSTIRSSSNPLFIGAGWSPDYFYGNVGETRIYNVALSATQVLQNYNATKGRYGL
jgi:hypothetical protein